MAIEENPLLGEDEMGPVAIGAEYHRRYGNRRSSLVGVHLVRVDNPLPWDDVTDLL